MSSRTKIAILLTFISCGVAFAEDETNAEFFRKYGPHPEIVTSNASALPHNQVTDLIAKETRNLLGANWVPTMLSIAKVESGYRCNAIGPRLGRKHGGERAMGVFQVLPSSARSLGYTGPSSGLLQCDVGVRVGLQHAIMCKNDGVRSAVEMASCHVSGLAWKYPLHKKSERYRRKYIRMVRHKQSYNVEGDIAWQETIRN